MSHINNHTPQLTIGQLCLITEQRSIVALLKIRNVPWYGNRSSRLWAHWPGNESTSETRKLGQHCRLYTGSQKTGRCAPLSSYLLQGGERKTGGFKLGYICRERRKLSTAPAQNTEARFLRPSHSSWHTKSDLGKKLLIHYGDIINPHLKSGLIWLNMTL